MPIRGLQSAPTKLMSLIETTLHRVSEGVPDSMTITSNYLRPVITTNRLYEFGVKVSPRSESSLMMVRGPESRPFDHELCMRGHLSRPIAFTPHGPWWHFGQNIQSVLLRPVFNANCWYLRGDHNPRPLLALVSLNRDHCYLKCI